MVEFLNIDCMTYMATCKDKQFDLAIVDPPYGLGMSDYKRSGDIKFNMSKKWDDKIPNQEYFNELNRVSGNQIVWGGNYFTEFLKPTKGWIFWNKKQNGNLQIAEMAWTSLDNMKYFERIWQLDRNWQLEKIHPTQKPIQLYKWLLKNYATPDMEIIDTHGGSMSLAIAGYDFGIKKLVICEIDKEYYDDGVKRFETHKLQQTINFG